MWRGFLGLLDRILPRFLKRLVGGIYVWVAVRLGTNHLSFAGEQTRRKLRYTTFPEFVVCLKLATNDSSLSEGLSTSLFELSDDFDAAIDIGAHHGLYTVLLSKLNPDLDLYAFEPNDYNRNILCNFLSVNGVEADVRPDAVTGATDSVTFYERSEPGSESHSTTADQAVQTTAITVESQALSEFFEEFDIHHPFVKIDAEGAEDRIIEDVIRNANIEGLAGVVEMHPDKMEMTIEELVSKMEQAGWEVQFIGDTTGPGWSPRPAYRFHAGELS